MSATEAPAAAPSAAPTPGGGGRLLLRSLGVLLAVVLVAGGALNIVGSLARDSARVQRTYAGVRVVDVDVSLESVEVRAAAGGDRTRLDRTVSWSLGRPSYSQRLVGDRLVLRSSCPVWSVGRGCGGRVLLVVPAGTVVRAHTSAGSMRVTGLAGRLDLDSSAGSVSGAGLRSADVVASSSAGSVRLGFAAVPGRVRADSSAGSVEVTVPPGPTAYAVSAGSSAGSTHVDVRTDRASPRRIDAHSSAGSVHVGYPR